MRIMKMFWFNVRNGHFRATKDKFMKYFVCKTSVALVTDMWWWCWIAQVVVGSHGVVRRVRERDVALGAGAPKSRWV